VLLLTLSSQYRIAWSSGSFHGHGKYCLTASAAQAWVEYLTSKYEDMLHWSESIEEAPLLDAIPSVEQVDVFVPEFDDLPNLLPSCYTCTTLEG
jgi:hypothetical protein